MIINIISELISDLTNKDFIENLLLIDFLKKETGLIKARLNERNYLTAIPLN